MFSLKLDFIMKLTNTKANALGAACHLDSSHISRLKNGTRNLPKNPSFVDDMSKYFATHINNAYQQDAICKELNIPKLPNNQDESAKLIKNWLLDKEGSNSRGLVYDDGIEAVEDIEEARRKDNIIISKPQKYYYGPFGKREAVSKWIPVYATGMIEPYYYPRLRDGLLQRTLFIAPGCAAVVSASACMNTEGMLNEFITDPKAIDALLREYDVLFGQSKKLMDIYDQNKIAQFWDIFEECTKAENDTIMMGKMPTLVTMPEWVAQNMQKRAPGSKIYKYWKLLREYYLSLSTRKTYTEILAEFEGIETPLLPCGTILGAQGLQYTNDEWDAHIDSCKHFAKDNKFYKQVISNDIPDKMYVIANSDNRAFMIRNEAPEIAFSISENKMTSAFWEYLKRK